MITKRPLGISFIGYFYVFGAIVLLVTLITNPTEQFGIAMRFGLPNVPENIMKVCVSGIFIVIAYGYLKLKKWGYLFMMIYSSYFLLVSIMLTMQYNQRLFYGNVIWSVVVLLYTLKNRLYFQKDTVTL